MVAEALPPSVLPPARPDEFLAAIIARAGGYSRRRFVVGRGFGFIDPKLTVGYSRGCLPYDASLDSSFCSCIFSVTALVGSRSLVIGVADGVHRFTRIIHFVGKFQVRDDTLFPARRI